MAKSKYLIPATDPKCVRSNDGIWYRQIDKRMARKLFGAGERILMLSANLRFTNVWQPPMPCQKEDYSFEGYSFDQICDRYMLFNCDAVRGNYIHFYIKLDDYLKTLPQ